MRISIIIAAHNEGEALGKTIETCIATCSRLDHEIIIVDDASTDGSVDQIANRFLSLHIERHANRLGAAPTKSKGASVARGEIFVFLDGHCKPEPGAIATLAGHIEAGGQMNVFTPAVANLDTQNWKSDLSQVGHGYYLDLRDLDCGWLQLKDLRKVNHRQGPLYESPSLIGCAFAVSRQLYERLWGFDQKMLYWGVEDLHFGLKCWLMGHRILHDPKVVIGHRFRSTFDNYVVPVEYPLVNKVRMARSCFTDGVWRAWVERCRQKSQGGLAGHPEGLWGRAWHLFESDRPSVEQERSYLLSHREHDEFWYADRFGLPWPRVSTLGAEESEFAFHTASAAPSGGPGGSSAPPGATLQIVDTTNNAVVNGKTITKIVGQKIALQVKAQPSGAVSSIQWTVPGSPIKNYTQSDATATITNLAAADFQAVTTGFFWIAPGSFAVNVAATVGGKRLTASVTCQVQAPTNVSMTSVTGAVAVSNPGIADSGLELHFGTNATPGISWTFKATAPASGAGQIVATQLVNTVRTHTPAGGAQETLTSGGVYVLDSGVPYDPAVAIAAGSAATWLQTDSPGEPLTADLTQVSVKDQFQIYFMYQSSEDDSIWVTIGVLAWNWAGQTTIVPPAANNSWSAPTGVSNSNNPSGSASTTLPVWTKNVSSLTFS